MTEHHGEAGDFYVVGVGASAGGLEALERLFSHLPADTGMAFVILQHLSPDFKSGFEVARLVRANGANGSTRLVVLSGYGQDSDVDAALEAGFDDHITKPPDPDRLDQLLAGIGEPQPPAEPGGTGVKLMP